MLSSLGAGENSRQDDAYGTTGGAVEESLVERETEVEIEGDMEMEGEGGNVPLYCYCNRPSFGKMVACDDESCSYEWFHQECLEQRGRKIEEDSERKWYCEACLGKKKQQEEEDKVYGDNGKVTYNGMITVTLRQMPKGAATFEQICQYIGDRWDKHLNWKLENDVRKTPVWRSSVRKILLSNTKFQRVGPEAKLFTFTRKK